VSETDLVTAGTAPEAGAPDTTGGSAAPARRKGLSTMVLAELRQLAGELNIADTAKMRKGDLIAAIKERQAGGPAPQLPLPRPEPELSCPPTPSGGTKVWVTAPSSPSLDLTVVRLGEPPVRGVNLTRRFPLFSFQGTRRGFQRRPSVQPFACFRGR
jgi:hypothetical protein